MYGVKNLITNTSDNLGNKSYKCMDVASLRHSCTTVEAGCGYSYKIPAQILQSQTVATIPALSL